MTDNAADKKLPKMSRVDAAAVLLMSLGEAEAAQILKHMGPKEVQRVGTAMATLKDITQDQVEAVMIDFLESVGKQTGMGIGSDQFIKNMRMMSYFSRLPYIICQPHNKCFSV